MGVLALLSLSGCGWFERAERPIWRTQAENLCLSRELVKPSAYVAPQPEIDGPGICGMTHPFKVSALADGTVSVDKAVTIDCSMIPALEAWLAEVVQPSAEARFGSNVVGLEAFGAYSCRGVDNVPGARLSEHAFGNAIDVAGFKLADGREISIVRDWKKADSQESAFLHEIHAGACQHFTTVLGPGADVFHYNHFHLDLAMHGTTNTGPRRYCRPEPPPDLAPAPNRPDGLPPAPDIDEPMDIARAAGRPGSGPLELRGPSGALPPPLQALDERPAPPPILPAENGGAIDTEPTSSIPLSRED
ncbi:MAG: extensin family protein [Roseiarcus sp.]